MNGPALWRSGAWPCRTAEDVVTSSREVSSDRESTTAELGAPGESESVSGVSLWRASLTELIPAYVCTVRAMHVCVCVV